jgi:phage shock protein PspC (stress-responsive transcriptional regulator)
MMIRLILILIIIILIARAFIIYASESNEEKSEPDFKKKQNKPQRGVPKGIGEYIDYEEVKKL